MADKFTVTGVLQNTVNVNGRIYDKETIQTHLKALDGKISHPDHMFIGVKKTWTHPRRKSLKDRKFDAVREAQKKESENRVFDPRMITWDYSLPKKTQDYIDRYKKRGEELRKYPLSKQERKEIKQIGGGYKKRINRTIEKFNGNRASRKKLAYKSGGMITARSSYKIIPEPLQVHPNARRIVKKLKLNHILLGQFTHPQSIFQTASRVRAKTIPFDLVETKPIESPTQSFMYLDTIHKK